MHSDTTHTLHTKRHQCEYKYKQLMLTRGIQFDYTAWCPVTGLTPKKAFNASVLTISRHANK